MSFSIDAACISSRGKVRENNEDNFYFDGRCMEEKNNGLKHPLSMKKTLQKELCVAVFDGMGGENFGEAASFVSAKTLQEKIKILDSYAIQERTFLQDMCFDMNRAVLEKAKEKRTSKMGTTVAMLFFSHGYVYACNIGDSRIYRLRDQGLLQLSIDHVDEHARIMNPKKAIVISESWY